jgi:hypothetical protein
LCVLTKIDRFRLFSITWENKKSHWEKSIVMTVITAQWTIDEYHRMIVGGILSDRQVELLKGK